MMIVMLLMVGFATGLFGGVIYVMVWLWLLDRPTYARLEAKIKPVSESPRPKHKAEHVARLLGHKGPFVWTDCESVSHMVCGNLLFTADSYGRWDMYVNPQGCLP